MVADFPNPPTPRADPPRADAMLILVVGAAARTDGDRDILRGGGRLGDGPFERWRAELGWERGPDDTRRADETY